MEEAELELIKSKMRSDIIQEVRQSMLEKAAEITCSNCYHKMHIMVITNLEK